MILNACIQNSCKKIIMDLFFVKIGFMEKIAKLPFLRKFELKSAPEGIKSGG